MNRIVYGMFHLLACLYLVVYTICSHNNLNLEPRQGLKQNEVDTLPNQRLFQPNMEEVQRTARMYWLNRCVAGCLGIRRITQLRNSVFKRSCQGLLNFRQWESNAEFVQGFGLCSDNFQELCGSLIFNRILPISGLWFLRIRSEDYSVSAVAIPEHNLQVKLQILKLTNRLEMLELDETQTWKSAVAAGMMQDFTIKDIILNDIHLALQVNGKLKFGEFQVNSNLVLNQHHLAFLFRLEDAYVERLRSNLFGAATAFFSAIDFINDSEFFLMTGASINDAVGKLRPSRSLIVLSPGLNFKSRVSVKSNAMNSPSAFLAVVNALFVLDCNWNRNSLTGTLKREEGKIISVTDFFHILPTTSFIFNYAPIQAPMSVKFIGTFRYGSENCWMNFKYWANDCNPNSESKCKFFIELIQKGTRIMWGLKIVLLGFKATELSTIPAQFTSASFSFNADVRIGTDPSRMETHVTIHIDFSNSEFSYLLFDRLHLGGVASCFGNLKWTLPFYFGRIMLESLKLTKASNSISNIIFPFLCEGSGSIYGHSGKIQFLIAVEKWVIILDSTEAWVTNVFCITLNNHNTFGPKMIWQFMGTDLQHFLIGTITSQYFQAIGVSFVFKDSKYSFSSPGQMYGYNVVVSGTFVYHTASISTTPSPFSLIINDNRFYDDLKLKLPGIRNKALTVKVEGYLETAAITIHMQLLGTDKIVECKTLEIKPETFLSIATACATTLLSNGKV